MVPYKVFRASTDPNLHVICGGGLAGFDRLPERVRKLGPWQGAREGEVARLRPHYRKSARHWLHRCVRRNKPLRRVWALAA